MPSAPSPAHRALLAPLLFLGLLAGPGCVSGTYRRDSRYVPVSDASLRELAPGKSGLDDALAALGAPLWVFELPEGAIAIAYGWLHRRGWSIRVVAPLPHDASASFDYDSKDADMRGAVLFFDGDLVLREVRRGSLRDLTAELRERRPAPVDE